MANVLLLRFDETADVVRPQDAMENLGDLDIEAGLVMPTIVDAALGRGRRFVAAGGRGYRAQDVVPGATLLTRDMSIQVMLNWQIAAQAAYGSPGTIYAHGKGTAAAEYCSGALELRVVNAAAGIGEARWLWHDIAGALKTQIGGHFIASASDFMLLTATRRWVDTNTVILRYYLGDILVLEVPSVDGSIGGGTTGTTSIGTRWTGAAWDRFFDGTIDELRVVDYELTFEEIRATWRRITLHQPRGYDLLRDLHDPGFPISGDPDSRVQRETRMIGNALGYAVGQAENVRDNVLPDTAYGDVLQSWEQITAQAPKGGDSVDTRRARVVARMKQRAGISVPGVLEALRELADTDVANLQILAFSQDTVEDYGAAGLNTLRWLYDPPAQWTIAANALRVQNAASITFDGATRDWYVARMPVGGNCAGAHILAKFVPTTLAANAEVGVFFGDRAAGNFILLGYRNNAGTFQIITESFTSWASQGVTVRATLGGLVTAWLHLFVEPPTSGFGPNVKVTAAFATAAEAGPYTSTSGIDSGFAKAQWAGLYARTVGGAANIDVAIDDTKVRQAASDRPFHLYVYRDPALSGQPDVVGANLILRGLRQAHTEAAFITAKIALCDDPNTTCDSTPLGGI